MPGPVLLYDGDCAFCRRAVRRWVPPGGPVEAVPSQEPRAQSLLARHGLHDTVRKTVVLVDGDRTWQKTAALVRTLWAAGGGRRALGGLLWIVPRPVRDAGYDWVARNRHRVGTRRGGRR